MSMRTLPQTDANKTQRSTGEELLLRALQDLCVRDGQPALSLDSPFCRDKDNLKPVLEDSSQSFPTTSPVASFKTIVPTVYRPRGYNLFGPKEEALAVPPRKGLSSAPSCAGSEAPSQVIADFFSESGSCSSSVHTEYDTADSKLILWQAILIAVGYCESHDGQIVKDVKRPPHFPDPPIPVPDSLTACRKLIQENVFINIVNFKKSQLSREPLLLFNNNEEMWEYTKKYARFIKLTRAKQDLLNPLLRNFRWKSQSPTLPEQEQSLTGGDVANKVGKSGIDGGEEDDRSPRFIASPSMLNVPPRLEFEDVQDANLKADNGDVVESVVIFVQ